MRWSALCILVVLAEVLVFFRHVLFDSAYAIPWDFRSYHLPLASFAAESFGRGELPLWDPTTYCGRPLYANLTAQVFYPPAWPVFLSGGGGGLLDLLEWQIAGHVFFAGVTTFWLLRRMGVGRAASLTGATVYQLGAFFASQAQHLGAMNGAAWLPVIWLCVWELRERLQWRWLALATAAFTMNLLAGFPAVTAVAWGSSLMLAGFLGRGWRAPLRVMAAAAWSLPAAAVQLLPSLELNSLSVSRFRGDFAGPSAMPSAALVSLVWPNYHGIFDLAAFKGPWEPTFLYLYCGLPALTFAMIALTGRRRTPAVWFAATALLSGLYMMGLFDRLIPRPVAAATYPEFALAAFTLATAVVAAFGVEHFLGRGSAWMGAALVAVTAADLTLAGSGRPMNRIEIAKDPAVTRTHFDGNAVVLEAVRALTRRPAGEGPPWRIDTIGDSMAWAMAAPLTGVPTANGNDPFALESILELRRRFTGGERWGRYYEVAWPDSPLLDFLGVRYLLSRRRLGPEALRQGGLREAAVLPGRFVYENPGALARFFLADAADPARPLAPVRVIGYDARELTIDAEASRPLLLVSSEANYPGWRAWIDGRETGIRTVKGAFRAVSLPAGKHRVRMRFEPRILGYAAGVSLMAWLALLVAAIFPRRL